MSEQDASNRTILEIPLELKKAVEQDDWKTVQALVEGARGILRAILVQVFLVENTRSLEMSEGRGAHHSDTIVHDHQEVWGLEGQALTRALLKKLVDGTLSPTVVQSWLQEYEESATRLGLILREYPI